MGITLYHFPRSPPSRGALLAAKAVGVDVDVQIVNLSAKEQFKDEFIKVKFEQLIAHILHNIMKYYLRSIHNILYQLWLMVI